MPHWYAMDRIKAMPADMGGNVMARVHFFPLTRFRHQNDVAMSESVG